MRGSGRMIDAGFPIAWGVGRHGPGDNVFSYFIDPVGTVIEYTADRKLSINKSDTPIAELVRMMSDDGLHHVPIVDASKQLVGIVTQTDLVAALYDMSLAQLEGKAA